MFRLSANFRTSSWAAVLIFLYIYACSVTAFSRANPPLNLLSMGPNVTVSQKCGDEFGCRSQFDSATCVNEGVCYENRFCGGRTDFPVQHRPLQSWPMTNLSTACEIKTTIPLGIGKLTFGDNVKSVHVNGSSGSGQACNARGNIINQDVFTLIFWLSADCDNCSVLELSQDEDKKPVHIRVVDGTLCIDGQCFGNTGIKKWIFVVVKVYKKTLTVYMDKVKLNLTNPPLQDMDVTNIFIGSTEVASPGNDFMLYDVVYYDDILTLKEIEELEMELANYYLTDNCRCPPSHLIHINDTTCRDDESDSVVPRYNTTIHFNAPSVLIDPTKNAKWASAENGTVVLTLAFSQAFEVESISIEFASSLPGSSSISLKYLDLEKAEQQLQCNGVKCEISFQQNNAVPTVSYYMARVADGINIILNRNGASDVRSFVINNITVIGRCDCHGNADKCNVTDSSYVCLCKADTNSVGPNCKACVPNQFREVTDFDCPSQCSCSASGVLDVNDQCEEVGGQCKCKELVTGPTCNECKPWTYGLDFNKAEGCSPCSCSQNGSLQCDSVSGTCTCKPDTQLPHCDACQANYFGFDMSEGCRPCNCTSTGTKSQSLACNDKTGQCECKDNVEGLRCGQCKPGFFYLDVANSKGCQPCDCHPVGIDQATCNQLSGQCSCRNGVITDKKCTPKVTSIDPKFGPEIGGTQITIHGQLLGNSTHQPKVFLGTAQQNNINIDDSKIIVETVQYDSSQGNRLDLRLSWDEVSNPLPLTSFSYQSNPVLNYSKPSDVYSFVSGGCLVEVYGTNLGSVKYPRLNIINKANPNIVAQSICYHVPDSVRCYTPGVKDLYKSPQDMFEMTFMFDGVTSSSLGQIFIREDAVLYNAGNIRFQYPFEKTITLHGKNLQAACQSTGIEVHTGVIYCDIVSVSNTHIECEPHGSKPKSGDKRIIKVKIGNISKVVGTLEYLEFYETNAFIITCSCIGAVILLVIILIIVCRCRRYRRQLASANAKLTPSTVTTNRQMNTYSEITQLVNTPNSASNGHTGMVLMENVAREHKKGIVNSEAETSVLNDEFLPYIEPSIRDTVRDNFVGGNSITIGSCRKTGQNAKVMEGTLKRNGVEIQKLTIRSLAQPITAILKSQPDSGPSVMPWANIALSECLRLRHLKHNHILNCLGIGLAYSRFHLLYSFYKKGTLKDLIADTNEEYSVRQLLGFSQQVATGVAYLASKDITHKDVAARNCMVDEYSVVKIGDASFSWDFYPKEYVYNEQRERYLPIRWMAPESLTAGYYDKKTDVWSFGVFVWELLTRGCLPFHEVNDEQVTDYVLNGYILGKPETISDNVYELLRSCWGPESESRPLMKSLARSLLYILESEADDTYANGYLVTAQLTQGVSTPRRGNGVNSHVYSSTDMSQV